MNKYITFTLILVFASTLLSQEPYVDYLPEPQIDFNPKSYICYRTESPIVVDGRMNEKIWQKADWTDDFVDIEGDLKPDPLHRTRVKMLWDDEYLYVAAEITEPHIWANITRRDAVIFYDNDFEVFIDPDGDSHNYMEFEMNALNTLWDLFLLHPYRENGASVINSWTINGIESAVKIYGTINDPSDTDEYWVVELAFPIYVLTELGSKPSEGIQWRINFSRVNWRTIINEGEYIKEKDPETGKNYPEFNWVWSPQGVVNMHYPETWGFLQFTETIAGNGYIEFIYNDDESLKWDLRTLYYAQRKYASNHKSYCANAKALKKYGFEGNADDVSILVKSLGYEACMVSPYSGLLWTINDAGRVFSRKINNK